MNSKSLHAESVSSLFGRKGQACKTNDDEVIHDFVIDSSRESLVTRLRSLAYLSPSSTDDPPSDAAIDSDSTVSLLSTSSPEEEFEALYSNASFDLETNHSMARELETATAELQHCTALPVLHIDKDNVGDSNKGDDDGDDDIDNDNDSKGQCEPLESDELARLTQLILFKSASTSKEDDRARTSSPPLRLLNRNRKEDEVKVTYKGHLIAFLSRKSTTNDLSCNKDRMSNKSRLGWTARVHSHLSKFRWASMQKKADISIIEDCSNIGTKDDSWTSGFGGKAYCEDEKTDVNVKGRETRTVDAETGVNAMSHLITCDDAIERQRNEEGDIDSHPDDEVAVLPMSNVVENDERQSARFVEEFEESVYKNSECVDDCEEFVYKNTECVELSCSLGWHKQSEPEDIADNEKDWFDPAALNEVDNKNWLDTAFDRVDKVLESVLNLVEKACYRERGV